MADLNQYLRLRLGEATYLLPSTTTFTIEQRDNLVTNKAPEGNVAAWRAMRTERIPAYCLDSLLKPVRRQNWQRAVFLDAKPQAVGLIADEVELLPRAETQVAPFVPLGLPLTRNGHLFSGAWLSGKHVALVLDPKALIAYLQSLGA